jgi:hypothetical protein
VSTDTWAPFGTTEDDWSTAQVNDTPHGVEQRVLNLTWRKGREARDRAGRWLGGAMLALSVLAIGAAVVSFQAQYAMVYAAKHVAAIAALEAGVPDVSAVVFAALGIALALHGKRAIRARLLNAGAIATSIAMNAMAAGGGWRDMAIWVMPPVAYALASDTCIGVIRAYTTARQRGGALADEVTPLALAGRAVLWSIRLALAPRSTLRGFRNYVITACPVDEPAAGLPAPAVPWPGPAPAIPAPDEAARKPSARRERPRKSKTARFLGLVEERYGPLAQLDPARVSPISTELAPRAGLNTGSARSVLGQRVKAARERSQP